MPNHNNLIYRVVLLTGPESFKTFRIRNQMLFGKIVAHLIGRNESFKMRYRFAKLRLKTYEKIFQHWKIVKFWNRKFHEIWGLKLADFDIFSPLFFTKYFMPIIQCCEVISLIFNRKLVKRWFIWKPTVSVIISATFYPKMPQNPFQQCTTGSLWYKIFYKNCC